MKKKPTFFFDPEFIRPHFITYSIYWNSDYSKNPHTHCFASVTIFNDHYLITFSSSSSISFNQSQLEELIDKISELKFQQFKQSK